jgi:hypothetical protein
MLAAMERRPLAANALGIALALVAAALNADAEPNKASPTGDPPVAAPPAAAAPQARVDGIVVDADATSDALVLTDTVAKKTYRLHPIAAAVYASSDGKTSVEAIAKSVSEGLGSTITADDVWDLCDLLADANLLVARVTPAGLHPGSFLVLPDGTDANGAVALQSDTAQKAAPAQSAADRRGKLAKEKDRKVSHRDSIRAEEAKKVSDPEIAALRTQRGKIRERFKSASEQEQKTLTVAATEVSGHELRKRRKSEEAKKFQQHDLQKR